MRASDEERSTSSSWNLSSDVICFAICVVVVTDSSAVCSSLAVGIVVSAPCRSVDDLCELSKKKVNF